jgi:hypothetical protein
MGSRRGWDGGREGEVVGHVKNARNVCLCMMNDSVQDFDTIFAHL